MNCTETAADWRRDGVGGDYWFSNETLVWVRLKFFPPATESFETIVCSRSRGTGRSAKELTAAHSRTSLRGKHLDRQILTIKMTGAIVVADLRWRDATCLERASRCSPVWRR
jgi:hypothetical protein